MSGSVNIGGTWKNIASVSVNIGGAWKTATSMKCNIGGVWKDGWSSGGGGIDTYTKLMLHMNGTNGSTTFTDSSLSPKTVTENGSASISTSQNKFGGASGYFEGTTSYLSSANSSDFDFSNGDWTIDWWEFRTASTSGKISIARESSGGVIPFILGYSDGTNLGIYISSDNSGWNIASAKSLGSISLNTWIHLEVGRSGNTFYAFKNGVQTDAWTSSLSIASSSNLFSIGKYGTTYYQGYQDELRISKGICRHTTDFTPPTQEYST